MGSMLENKGVQMMLSNLLKSAAPELMETVGSIADFLKSIVETLHRLEENQQEILRRLNDERRDDANEPDTARAATGTLTIAGPVGSVGNGAREGDGNA